MAKTAAHTKRPERVTELACGCSIHVCLCGCDENNTLRECRTHRNAQAVLDLLRAMLPAYADFLRGVGADPKQSEHIRKAKKLVGGHHGRA